MLRFGNRVHFVLIFFGIWFRLKDFFLIYKSSAHKVEHGMQIALLLQPIKNAFYFTKIQNANSRNKTHLG